MWTRHWPLGKLQSINGEMRELIQTQWWEANCEHLKRKHGRRVLLTCHCKNWPFYRDNKMFINCKFIDFLLECTYFERHAQVCGVTSLNLATPDTSCSSQQALEKRTSRYEMEDQRLQGRLLWTRWEDGQLSEHGCFAWSSGCAWASTHTISGVFGALWAAVIA